MSADVFGWLMQPLSGAAEHHLPAWASWHGRCMVLSWGVLVPLLVVVARFFKVMPGQAWPQVLDNKRWWYSHFHGQILAMVLASVGVALASGQGHGAYALAGWHHRLGWLMLAFGGVQLAAGLLRGSKGGPTAALLRGDHYDMTSHRVWFERLHKSLGYVAMALAWTCIALGLVLADAPRWLVVLVGGWWLLLGGIFACLQSRGWAMDTYQAVWGPDAHHPGNQREPIGWDVRRYTAASFAQWRGSKVAKK